MNFQKWLLTTMTVMIMMTTLFNGTLFAETNSPVKTPPAKKIPPIRLPNGEILEPHVPKVAPTKKTTLHHEALTWFMTGQVLEIKEEFYKAYDAYKKAHTLAPKSIEVHLALLPLAFGLGKKAEGMRYIRQAVKIDPQNYNFLRQLSVLLTMQNKTSEAIDVLELAVQSPTLKRQSIDYVLLTRDLAILYSGLLLKDDLTQKKKKAAQKKLTDAYLVLYEARTTPKKFNIAPHVHKQLATDSVSSFEEMGRHFLIAQRPLLAIRAFELLQKERGQKPSSLDVDIARAYFQTKKYPQAEKQLQRYFNAQLTLQGRSAYTLLAQILNAQKQSKTLIPRLEKMAKADQFNNDLQLYLAEQYVNKKQFQKAELLYRATLKNHKTTAGHLALAKLFRLQNQSDNWLQEVAKILETAQRRSELVLKLAAIELEINTMIENKKLTDQLIASGKKQAASTTKPLTYPQDFVLAKLAAAAKKTAAVTIFYEQALKNKPVLVSLFYTEYGEYLLRNSEFKKAAAVFRRAIANPVMVAQKASFLFRLSQAEESAGNTKAALKAIHDAQKILPKIPLLRFQEGLIYYQAQQWKQAAAQFEEVIKKFPTDQKIVRQSQSLLSNVYVSQGDRRKGEKILEEVYAENPDDPGVNNDLGYLWAEGGKNLQQAEKMIRKAVTAEPENRAYQDSLGWVLFMQKKYVKALPFLKNAVKGSETGDETVWDHLGDCYHRLGKKTEAVNAWKRALKSALKNKRADKKLIEKIKEKLQKLQKSQQE